ncbi:hypothetical protein EAI_06354 [Harpegnathos saltator]|uniref:Uncharacterized protein n=1 Tax=Harpegnathos saltator TaxID=610380 RepID=E2BSE7_HARSA|nr:hypothetical protein EAI_06354 [Harpegnathos saltator]
MHKKIRIEIKRSPQPTGPERRSPQQTEPKTGLLQLTKPGGTKPTQTRFETGQLQKTELEETKLGPAGRTTSQVRRKDPGPCNPRPTEPERSPEQRIEPEDDTKDRTGAGKRAVPVFDVSDDDGE